MDGFHHRRARQLEAVRVITREVTQELDLARLLELLVRRTVELTAAGASTIWLWDAEGEILVPKDYYETVDAWPR